MLVCSVVGARPNLMKMAPLILELRRRGVPQLFVHTGQHYDPGMSRAVSEDLGLPEPDIELGVGSASHAEQTARVMVGFERVCRDRRPNLVVAGGDVNSTLAVALVAAKERIPIAHVEAGLRSFDRSMPEEINRVVTDHLSALLFTTEESGNRNLEREGVDAAGVHLVGNCMVDSLRKHVQFAVEGSPWESFGLSPGEYGVATLHRPSNVDDPDVLAGLLRVLSEIGERVPIIFPVHPRTRDRLAGVSRSPAGPGLRLCEPLSYVPFLGLIARAKLVLTDSGGIQEETTALGVPCLTLRGNTERPITVERGTNRLVGTDPDRIRSAAAAVLAGEWPTGDLPPLWDGRASQRISDCIEGFLADKNEQARRLIRKA
jgi:UDP-N-acetylglucosamine 2-epimerase (non-hydrolysing)